MARKRNQTTKTVSKAVEQVVARTAEAAAKAAPVVEAVEKKAAPVVEAVEKKAAPVVEAVEKKAAPIVEAVEKKVAAKKPAKKTEMKTNVSVQYMGKDISEKDMIALVKKDWTAKKNKVGDIKTMELYVKVEENRVYYVINGEATGSVEI